MKKIILFAAACSLWVANLRADEGMWLISMLSSQNAGQMQNLGLHLTPDQIYSVNHTSMKDAIISFSGFCSGTIVSENGLIFTNHHCGYDAISKLSTKEHNYLDNGFWAGSYAEELPANGLFARFLVRIDDVSDSIVPFIQNMQPAARTAKVFSIYKRLIKRATDGTDYTADVKPIYYGNQYILSVYRTYNDVRLVGTAPQSMGKFGGDTDNWMWPRHTCDFSIFRVYADKDNKPAPYDKVNVPFKTKSYIPISIKGVKHGDYTMIIGYPGSTQRYITSYGVQNVMESDNPNYIRVFKCVTDAMKSQMDKDVTVRLKYSGDYASTMNSLKLWQGQLEGLRHEHTVDVKKADEVKFMTWLKTQPDSMQTKYGSLLDKAKDAYAALKPTGMNYANVAYGMLRLNLITNAEELGGVRKDLEAKGTPKDSIMADAGRLKKRVDKYFAESDYNTEKLTLLALLKQAWTDYPASARPAFLKYILNKYGAGGDNIDWNKMAMDMDAHCLWAGKDRINAFLDKPGIKMLNKDPMTALSDSLESDIAVLRPIISTQRTNLNVIQRNYLHALLQMKSGTHAFYPDANSTMRLTYGTVQPYSPRDAVDYKDETTIKGVLEKYIPGDAEFNIPDEVLRTARSGDFGDYAADGTLPVCFLSTNDITGGNSGSGVFNADGQMVGLAFDGNYEGTADEFVFSNSLNRTINVDIRYVLWVVDKVYHANHVMSDIKPIR